MPRLTPGRRSPAAPALLVALLLALGGLVLGAPVASAAADQTLFGSSSPTTASYADSAQLELGVTVVPRVAGSVTAVRFYKGTQNTGTHTGSVWGPDGRQLAATTFTGESASGWQTAQLAQPVSLSAGQRYVVSYYAPAGHYAVTKGGFASAFTSGDLTVPANGGVYRYGASGLPTSTFGGTNYFVDLVFQAASGTPDTTPPTISGTTVAGVADTSATVRWTTNEASTSQVAYGTSSAYGSTTSADSTLVTSHAQVISGLKASTTYHLQARSKDASGNAASSADVTFTTTAAGSFNPGNPTGTATVPSGMELEDASRPDHVVGTGTAASCTPAALTSAVAAGGVVTFSCGSSPVTITLTSTLKVSNSTARLVLDGGGKVTISGGGKNRILCVDTCDTTLGKVSGNCLYSPEGPRVTVQNLTLSDGNATNATYVSPGDTNQGSNGGGAIFQLGGRLKVVRSVFVRNVCATNGPDLGGGAIRVLAQHSATPGDLDGSQAARNQEPAAIVQSTFGGASGQGNSCSNGGAISGLRTPITVVNSLITDNAAVGCCANPAHSGTPGGGSGGAIYTDGDTYDLRVLGSDLERNSAKAGGSAIFYVSNDLTGHLAVESSVSKLNVYKPSGYSPSDQHFETYPGIFYRGYKDPSFTGSTIE